jgi:predicted nucleic acid-binding protein
MAKIKILDTDVLVDYFRGVAVAQDYIERISPDQRSTTDVTLMELFRGAQNRRQLVNVEKFMTANFAIVLPISAVASRVAVDLVKRYSLAQGLTLPDALIAAIVLSADGTLVTGNKKHFEFITDLDVETPSYRSSP